MFYSWVDFVQALQQQVGQLKEEADSIPLAEKNSDHMELIGQYSADVVPGGIPSWCQIWSWWQASDYWCFEGDNKAIDFDVRSFFQWIFAFLISCKNGVLKVTYI